MFTSTTFEKSHKSVVFLEEKLQLLLKTFLCEVRRGGKDRSGYSSRLIIFLVKQSGVRSCLLKKRTQMHKSEEAKNGTPFRCVACLT